MNGKAAGQSVLRRQRLEFVWKFRVSCVRPRWIWIGGLCLYFLSYVKLVNDATSLALNIVQTLLQLVGRHTHHVEAYFIICIGLWKQLQTYCHPKQANLQSSQDPLRE